MPMEVQMVDGAPAPIFYRDIWHLRWPKILWATLPKIIGSIALPVAGKAKAPKAAPPPIEPAELSIYNWGHNLRFSSSWSGSSTTILVLVAAIDPYIIGPDGPRAAIGLVILHPYRCPYI
jgi:hypothetical protein